jgi:hypothetical protein
MWDYVKSNHINTSKVVKEREGEITALKIELKIFEDGNKEI